MDNQQKTIEELKGEMTSLKIRMRRIESFIESMPNPEEYVSEKDVGGMVEEAKEIVSQYDRASASLLQRKLSIGYARAAALLDLLEDQGVVGPATGSEPREVLIKKNLPKSSPEN